MPLTNIQQDVLSSIQDLASNLVSDKGTFTKLIGMWGNEFPTMPTQEQLEEYEPFKHMTVQELSDAAGALVAINTVLGEFSVAGSNVVKLLKIVANVPK